MSITLYDNLAERTKRPYVLKCQVSAIETSYDDIQSKGSLGSVSEKMIYLKPETSSECARFFDAWLPDGIFTRPDGTTVGKGHHEVAVQCGHPINGYFRCAVKRKDKDFPHHHLFVMTMSAEKDLIEMDGKTIIITVLGEDDEHLAEKAKPTDLAVNINA